MRSTLTRDSPLVRRAIRVLARELRDHRPPLRLQCGNPQS